ncbi:hypothetical protein CALVIDRAFT_467125, partial [Calocera viscosa TUFC12733]
AETLKAEGNVLFGQKQYKDAALKYSVAIELSPENAVLWSNRAACNLNLKKYSDAATDASQATELDPSFARAWARLATAEQHLGSWTQAINAWDKALSALPTEGRSAAEEKQMKEYAEMLSNAQRALEATQENINDLAENNTINNFGSGKMPWERAEKMRTELVARGQEGMFSSAWLILGAYEAWSEGVGIMNELKKEDRNGQVAMTGRVGAIQQLSNAIIRDKRVFHIDDPEFLSKYNDQMRYEAFGRQAWQQGSADLILREAKERLAKSDWNAVRPALSVTVRGYIIRAFLTGGLMEDEAAAVTFYDDAVGILDGGRQLWADVPDDIRGVIFTKTFIRGVKALRLESYMTVRNRNRARFTLTKLKELADDLERDVREDPLDPEQPMGPGFTLAFYNGPLAQALAMQALYERELAEQGQTPSEQLPHLARAGELYAEAASHLPPDDEVHAWFLNSALGVFWQGGAPLKTTLPLMEMVKSSVPQMMRIWEHSQLALGGRDKVLQKTLWFEEDVQKALREGKVKMDDPV